MGLSEINMTKITKGKKTTARRLTIGRVSHGVSVEVWIIFTFSFVGDYVEACGRVDGDAASGLISTNFKFSRHVTLERTDDEVVVALLLKDNSSDMLRYSKYRSINCIIIIYLISFSRWL